ncbi:MAG: SGNH/GDSL hydrolase family protein [bacterium]
MKRIITLILMILMISLCSYYPVKAFFRFSSNTVDAPEITHPKSGSRYIPGTTPPRIEWTKVPGAIEYELQLALNSDFDEPFSVFFDDCFWDLSELIAQEIWDDLSIYLFIQVRAIQKNHLTTEWSEPIEFAKSVASAPKILSPVDDARFLPQKPMPVFKWSSPAFIHRFAIEFASDKFFINSFGIFEIDSSIVDCNIMGDQELWDPFIGTFYWRVWGLENGWVPTPPTAAYRFSKTVMNPPTLLTPEDQSRYPASSALPVFEWKPLAHHPNEYHIQFVYNDDPFPAGGSYILTTIPIFTFDSVGITQDIWDSFYGTLYWRVAGLDEFGNPGGFSDSFRLSKIAALNYMAFGDSITGGYGASDFETGYAGYPRQLQRMLRETRSNQINVFCEKDTSWFSGCHAYTGSEKIGNAVRTHGPQYSLIMLGVVDIVDPGASGCDHNDCHTIEHLTTIIDIVRSYYSIPFLATLTPVNPVSTRAHLQDKIDRLNDEIRDLAFSKGVTLVDLDEAFLDASMPLPSYFTYDPKTKEPDWAHFNDSGYLLIAETWLNYL